MKEEKEYNKEKMYMFFIDNLSIYILNHKLF